MNIKYASRAFFAESFNVNPKTVDRWIQLGMPSKKFGPARFIELGAAVEWVGKNRPFAAFHEGVGKVSGDDIHDFLNVVEFDIDGVRLDIGSAIRSLDTGPYPVIVKHADDGQLSELIVRFIGGVS